MLLNRTRDRNVCENLCIPYTVSKGEAIFLKLCNPFKVLYLHYVILSDFNVFKKKN